MTNQHHPLSIQHTETLAAAANQTTAGVAANVFRTSNYLVLEIGLPRCRPEHINLTLAADQLLVEAERHLGEAAVEDEREYLLRELPYGTIGRVFSFPGADLVHHDAQAHFANGMVIVTIPTQERDAYHHRVRGLEAPDDDQATVL